MMPEDYVPSGNLIAVWLKDGKPTGEKFTIKKEGEDNMTTLNELEAKYKQLGEEIEKFKQEQAKPKTGRWKPRYKEEYWVIGQGGDTDIYTWIESLFDNDRYALGNCFETEAEAEFEVEKLKVFAELSEYATEFVKGSRHWDFYWDHYSNELEYIWCDSYKYPVLYFPSKETAQQAIQDVGEERVKRYYLGVG